MSFTIWTGLAAVLLAGVLQGLFAVPMKFAPRWNYENIWLIYSLTGMVVLPWMLTTATVPHLVEVYSLTPMPVLVRIAGFGLCWGIGVADSVTHSQPSTVAHTSRPHLPGWNCDYAGGNRSLCARGNAERRRPKPRRICASPIILCWVHGLLPVGAVF